MAIYNHLISGLESNRDFAVQAKALAKKFGYILTKDVFESTIAYPLIKNNDDFVLKFSASKENSASKEIEFLNDFKKHDFIPNLYEIIRFKDIKNYSVLNKHFEECADDDPIGLIKDKISGEMLRYNKELSAIYRKQFFNELKIIHSKGYASLDLGFGNILVESTGRPRLYDFNDYTTVKEVNRSKFRELKREDINFFRTMFDGTNSEFS